MATSNMSYNGSFINYDDKTDYQAKINESVAKGDYTSAALYEAQRNAKLNGRGQGNKATTNYVNVYNGGKTNNQGGIIYENKINKLSDLPDNWSSATINGATYNKSGNKIYSQAGKFADGSFNNRLVGTGINNDTGEFTLDRASARKLYLDQMYSVGGGIKNYMDNSFIDALKNGTVNQWNNDLAAKTKADEEAKKLAALSAIENDDAKQRISHIKEDELALIDDDNSFETDMDDYLKTKVRSFARGY